MMDLLVQKGLNSAQEAVLKARFIALCQGLELPDHQAEIYYQDLYDLYTSCIKLEERVTKIPWRDLKTYWISLGS